MPPQVYDAFLWCLSNQVTYLPQEDERSQHVFSYDVTELNKWIMGSYKGLEQGCFWNVQHSISHMYIS